MKIGVSGKGGCGKSTLSVLLARSMKKLGYRVLLVDGDESNIGLENLTGISEPKHLMDYLGGKKGFKAKKRFFAEIVKFSGRLHTTHDLFLGGNAVRWRHFHGYLAFMFDLSQSLVNDFLKHPESSPCLLHDPMGRRNLLLAKKRSAFPRLRRISRPVRRFDVDEDLLYL